MSKIKAYIIDGWVWHGAEVNGKAYLLRRVGRAGHCLLL
jgi:hypothetical protein